MEDRTLVVRSARAGFVARAGGKKRIAARAAFARALFRANGARRIPGQAELDAALTALTPDDLAWLCEFSPLGPLYFLPTRRWITALARELRKLGARTVLEVAAGDGVVSQALQAAAPELRVIATDSGAWQKPEARMNAREKRELRGRHVPGLALGANVQRLEARRAIAEYAPDVVLACWLPPGPLLDRLIRANVMHVLEVGAPDGVTPSAYSWRFAHEFLEGPLETTARCRLDVRPAEQLHSRVTLYFGAGHPEHFEERVGRDHWLYQYKPGAVSAT
jgi:hypothetical protein